MSEERPQRFRLLPPLPSKPLTSEERRSPVHLLGKQGIEWTKEKNAHSTDMPGWLAGGDAAGAARRSISRWEWMDEAGRSRRCTSPREGTRACLLTCLPLHPFARTSVWRHTSLLSASLPRSESLYVSRYPCEQPTSQPGIRPTDRS